MSSKGYKHTEEAKRRIAKSAKERAQGTRPSDLCIQRAKEANTGRPMSEEHRQKLSKLYKGKTRDPKIFDKSRGEENYNSVLSDSDVKDIRSKYRTGNFTYRQLGDEYGVSSADICNIVNNKTWRHLLTEDELNQDLSDAKKRSTESKLLISGEENAMAKLTDEKVILIRRLYGLGGHSYRSLAKQFGVSNVTIANIIKEKSWKHLL